MNNKKQIPQNKKKIDEFKDVLYSRKNKFSKHTRRSLKKNIIKQESASWKDVEEKFSEPKENLFNTAREKKILPFAVILIISIIFFLGAVSYAFFFLFMNEKIEKQEIELFLTGPISVNSGSEFEFNVRLENNTKWDFENISINIKYPDSTIDNQTGRLIKNDLIKIEQPLKTGENINKKFNVILSGIENEQKDITVSIFYSPLGFSNTISSTKIYQLRINSSPVSLNIDAPSQTISTEEFEMNLNIVSNTNSNLDSLILTVNFPQGFTPESFSVEPIFLNSAMAIFKTAKILPGGEENIKIKGNLSGQNNEKKIFNFEVGDVNPLKNQIRTLFAQSAKQIFIKAPALQLNVSVNGLSEAIYIAKTAEKLRINFDIINNSDAIISDLLIEVTIEGTVYDQRAVRVKHGYYNSNKKNIIWNKNTWDNLVALKQQERVKSGFVMEIKNLEQLAGYYKNPNLKLRFKISGTNFDASGPASHIVFEEELNIKVASHIQIESGTLFSIGPIENIGVVPPVVGKKTTYTAVWKIYNSTNLIEDVVVRARLPHYVEFLGNISPEKYYVTYQPETREVTWRLRRVAAHTGHRTPPETVYFQVGIIPSANQIGAELSLIGPKTITATDTFIESQIFAKQKKSDTTEIKLDPNSRHKIGEVVAE